MDNYVLCEKCDKRHETLEERLKDGEVKFARIETQLQSIVTLLKITTTALCTGLAGIVTALLLRGI